MVQIQSLTISKEQKQIRELVNTPQGVIEVYEPTLDNIADIVDIQREGNLGMDTGVVRFDAVLVIKKLFPMLTNIEMGDISDEELENVIENPSVHLLIAQQAVAQIVAEANKLYAQRVRTELMNTESTMAQIELMNSIPALIIEKSKSDGTIGQLVKEVEKAEKGVNEAIKKEEAQSKE